MVEEHQEHEADFGSISHENRKKGQDTHTETDSVSSEDAAEMMTTEYVLYVDAPKMTN